MKVSLEYTSPHSRTVMRQKRNNNINFGFSMPKLKPGISSKTAKKLELEAEELTNLFLHPKDINFFEILKKSGKNRRSFLFALAERYNGVSYYQNPAERETPADILRIFDKIKKPKKYHNYIVSRLENSFSDNLVVLENLDKKTYELLSGLLPRVQGNKRFSKTLISDIFASSNRNEYLKHFDEYYSYFALNRADKDAVPKLDKLISSGKYNSKDYDAEYNAIHILRSPLFADNKFITKDFLKSNYSPEAAEFMDEFINSYLVRRRMSTLSPENAFDIMHMYETTNAKNLPVRAAVVEYFKFSTKDKYGKDISRSEITAMRKLFDKIDNNRYAKSFVEKFISKSDNIHTIASLDSFMDFIGAKKATIFFNNFNRVIRNVRVGERRMALEKGIENPFYETNAMRRKRKIDEQYKYVKPISIFKRARLYVGNLFNKLKYHLTPTEIKYEPIDSIAEQNGIKTAKINVWQTPCEIAREDAINNGLPFKLVGTLKLSPASKRLKVANDVQDIISNVLSAKTLEKQSGAYRANATAMKLKLLPEIFSSIKDTRKVARDIGKTRGNSSNNDALALYNLISGRNKKLVRYLLVKRNTDNSRMFEVKDIISIITKAENKIKKNNMKAADAKSYYEKLYNSYIEMYGLQKPIKKAATTKQPRITINNLVVNNKRVSGIAV